MTIDEAIGLLKTERTCVRHADICERNCDKCVLVQDTDELLEMYDSVCDWLKELEYYRKMNAKNPFLLDMHKHDQLVYNEALNDLVKRLNKKYLSRKDVSEIVEDLKKEDPVG